MLAVRRFARIGTILNIPKVSRASSIFHHGVMPQLGAFSRHFRTISQSEYQPFVESKDLERYLHDASVPFRRGHTSLIADCHVCSTSEDVGMDLMDRLSLYINKATGNHICSKCGTAGTWKEYQDQIQKLGSGNVLDEQSAGLHITQQNTEITNQFWRETRPIYDCDKFVIHQILDKFGIKGLSPNILKKYNVHLGDYEFLTPTGDKVEATCVVYPMYTFDRTGISQVKILNKTDDNETSITFDPKQGVFTGLFGWNTIKPTDKEVVLTANEFDAMAVHQVTGKPALSVTLGSSSLPLEAMAQLEQFERIILWLGSDDRARQATRLFSNKLQSYRCFFVSNEENKQLTSALEALQSNLNIRNMITKANPFNHDKILSFSQFRNDVYNELANHHKMCGVPFKRFPRLTDSLKGHRRGEVTVFTGQTGSGKTTLLSELSLDLAMQGVTTLWGSFEITNTRLNKVMLQQFARTNLRDEISQFTYWADKFEQLPFYYMNFYGSQSVKSVLQTMSHAVYVYDIEHVIIDNLQFMMSDRGAYDDIFSQHNQAINAFRVFATMQNVHVTIVIHPRKENEELVLQTSSIFGSAKAAQEADNVLILQSNKTDGSKCLQVTKNRYDGALGVVPLAFDPETLSMSNPVKMKNDAIKVKRFSPAETPQEDKEEQKETQFLGFSKGFAKPMQPAGTKLTESASTPQSTSAGFKLVGSAKDPRRKNVFYGKKMQQGGKDGSASEVSKAKEFPNEKQRFEKEFVPTKLYYQNRTTDKTTDSSWKGKWRRDEKTHESKASSYSYRENSFVNPNDYKRTGQVEDAQPDQETKPSESSFVNLNESTDYTKTDQAEEAEPDQESKSPVSDFVETNESSDYTKTDPAEDAETDQETKTFSKQEKKSSKVFNKSYSSNTFTPVTSSYRMNVQANSLAKQGATRASGIVPGSKQSSRAGSRITGSVKNASRNTLASIAKKIQLQTDLADKMQGLPEEGSTEDSGEGGFDGEFMDSDGIESPITADELDMCYDISSDP